MSKTPMTVKGAEKLRAQLQVLKTVDRPRITKAIAEARAHGDLSENAEYHAAREQQSFAEGRINAIESALAEAQIIDVTKIDAEGRVIFGATVDLLNIETDKEVTYQIVGEEEADFGMVTQELEHEIVPGIGNREVLREDLIKALFPPVLGCCTELEKLGK